MGRKCATIHLGVINFKPFTKSEFKKLKAGDRVETYLGDKGVFVRFKTIMGQGENTAAELSVSKENFTCPIYSYKELRKL